MPFHQLFTVCGHRSRECDRYKWMARDLVNRAQLIKQQRQEDLICHPLRTNAYSSRAQFTHLICNNSKLKWCGNNQSSQVCQGIHKETITSKVDRTAYHNQLAAVRMDTQDNSGNPRSTERRISKRMNRLEKWCQRSQNCSSVGNSSVQYTPCMALIETQKEFNRTEVLQWWVINRSVPQVSHSPSRVCNSFLNTRTDLSHRGWD